MHNVGWQAENSSNILPIIFKQRFFFNGKPQFLFFRLRLTSTTKRRLLYLKLIDCKYESHLQETFTITSRLLFDQTVSSVTQLCLTLCDPMNRSTPGLPVHHQLPEFTQTHAHRVGDAIQPSHPLSSPSPPALSVSQHQGLFK